MVQFGGLAARVGGSVLGSRVRVGLGLAPPGGGILSQEAVTLIADELCRMRGAALKLGQMLSIQDEALLPPQIAAALERVRQGADYMPARQLHAVLSAELGPAWRTRFAAFDDKPFAAASIGQVHRGLLADGGGEVAVKVQYPGVAASIDADLGNLSRLLVVSAVLPPGMFLENALAVARRELRWETDYLREARCMQLYAQLLDETPALGAGFVVPRVVPALSSARVLTSTMIAGEPLERLAQSEDASLRNDVAQRLLDLCLTELFDWAFMQTDPNFANFLFDAQTGRIGLCDFGASRSFARSFVDDYLRVVAAAARRDAAGVLEHSTALGFLTGDESPRMRDVHAAAVLVLGEPFASGEPFDFARQGISRDIHNMIPDMLRERRTPPPNESYSLHRKMAGTFLLCGKLRARVHCAPRFERVLREYRFGRPDDPRVNIDRPPGAPGI